MILYTIEVFGVLLRVLECQGKRWLCSEDISKVFEYRCSGTVTSVLARHKNDLDAHSIKGRIDGRGTKCRLFDEFALRYFCRYSPRPGAVHLLHWLDAGGLQADCDDVIPFDEAAAKSEGAFVFENVGGFAPEGKSANVGAFDTPPKSAGACAFELPPKPASAGAFDQPSPVDLLTSAAPLAEQMTKRLELERLYCVDLLEVLLTYCDLTEAEDTRVALDELIDGILKDRHCPDLNADRYDLYSRYWLVGGEV